MNRRSLFKGLFATIAAAPIVALVGRGKPYLNGEHGPELFMANYTPMPLSARGTIRFRMTALSGPNGYSRTAIGARG